MAKRPLLRCCQSAALAAAIGLMACSRESETATPVAPGGTAQTSTAKTTTSPAQPSPEGASQPVVYVTNYPLLYFSQRIAPGEFELRFPAPADEDPAYWQPPAETVAAMQNATLLLFNGATYEKFAGTVTLPDSKIVRTAAPFSDRFLELEHATTHSHGPGGEHSHTGTDFNTWLDPRLATRQARQIAESFAELVPAKADEFLANWNALDQDLAELDRTFKGMTMPYRGERTLMASHPVYAYWGERYGIGIEAMLWEPGEMPDPEQWAAFEAILAERPAQYMLWEDEPLDEIKAKLRELGVTPIVFLTANNVRDEGDYLEIMRANAARLEQAFPQPEVK
ncbi:MAG: metal ABC transporter substrate-binding protein [Sumerlaeia bacterium]